MTIRSSMPLRTRSPGSSAVWSSPSPPSPICRSRGNVSNKPTTSTQTGPSQPGLPDAPDAQPLQEQPRSLMRRAEYGAVITAVVFVMAMAAAGIWFGLEEVWHRMLTLDPAVLAGLLGLSLVNYMMRAWRWYIYSDHLNIQVSRRRTALYYFAGFAM